MALDMANSDARSATVRGLVLFYLMATDESSSSARTSAIHKEKFNVPQSDDEHIDMFNFVEHLNCKNLHWLSRNR